MAAVMASSPGLDFTIAARTTQASGQIAARIQKPIMIDQHRERSNIFFISATLAGQTKLTSGRGQPRIFADGLAKYRDQFAVNAKLMTQGYPE